MVHIYNGILLAIKNNEIMPLAATWMDLETIILREKSHTEKDIYCMISLICGIFLKTPQRWGGGGEEWAKWVKVEV